MNTKLALTAITLFAVTIGIGFLTPALAAKEAKILVCHFQEATTDWSGNSVPALWTVISINQNAESAQVGVHTNGAGLYDSVVNDTDGDPDNDSDDCLARPTGA